MRQLVQSLNSGLVTVENVPTPGIMPGHLLVRTRQSLISSGTERMLLEFGRAGWIGKARQQPDKARMVLEKARTDGLAATFEAVRSKLDQPLALGYSNAGVVLEVGAGACGFKPGDRVVSNGSHAEVVQAPKNLCARIPDEVSDADATFTVLGAIALQGLRLAQPAMGEVFVVTGLGLIGLLTVQLLRVQGCRVLGIDFDERKLALARDFGAETVDVSAGEQPLRVAERLSRGRGVDGVLITAATASDEPVHQAAEMCRKRGRIVLTGVTGLNLRRADFYKKELSFQVSCSYGPGRYDPVYEDGGQDYPVGFVRWTAQRNFEAVLDLLADRKIDTEPLVTHRFPLDRAAEAYELIRSEVPHLGVVLTYPSGADKTSESLRVQTLPIRPGMAGERSAVPVVGVLGAGQHATRVLLPAFRRSGARLKVVSDRAGLAAAHAATKFDFEAASTDESAVLSDAAVDTVVIATRHDSHARMACEALRAGKHVFVEKPLAIRAEELEDLRAAHRSAPAQLLMVGFNRRFAPHIAKMKQLLATGEPKSMVITVNAGMVPREHWTLDPETGGGRIIGEACHFVDLLRHLAGVSIVAANATKVDAETATISLGFADGSIGAIHYFGNGNRSFPKERLEVFCGGRILQLDNFRKLRGHGWPGFRKMNLWRQDKGHNSAVAAFVDAVRTGKPSPIPFEELVEVTSATFAVSR